MTWCKIGKALILPHISVLLLLFPISAVLLIYSLLCLAEIAPVRIGAYVLAFYTLTIWCVRVPKIVGFFKNLKNENRYINALTGDVRLRTNITLSGSVLWNGAYAALQLGTGIYHNSPWFYSLAAYYACLALMRFFILRHTLRSEPGREIDTELKYYKACGWIFLIMNMAISVMMLYMIHENRVTRHNEITTIAIAAYTFTTLTMAIINVIRYRKYNSPAMSASKAISLAAACVSMLTLENTMLTIFGGGDMTEHTKKIFLVLSGGAISIFIIVMALYMIIKGSGKNKETEEK